MQVPRLQQYAAELIDTAILLATVVGFGIMAETLANGHMAIALLCNTISTGAILVLLMTMLSPMSGAHFNPAVTLVFAVRREISIRQGCGYTLCPVVGGILGVVVAHMMFEEPLIQFS